MTPQQSAEAALAILAHTYTALDVARFAEMRYEEARILTALKAKVISHEDTVFLYSALK